MSEPRLYSASEAAEILHMSIDSVYDRVQQKMIRHRRIGRRVFFTEDDLQRFIDESLINPTELTDRSVQND